MWVKLIEKNKLKKGQNKQFIINNKKIAVFNYNGIFYALDDLCVHQDGSLASGKIQNGIVECPLHFWHYDIKSGKLLDYLDNIKITRYAIENRSDGVYVDI